MRRSKYLFKTFGNWTCTKVYLAANYNSCTHHNAYRYQLSRKTSDNKCIKSITVSGPTMLKISRGLCTVEQVVTNKLKSTKTINSILYKFT